ncbi:MAG: LptF/LptG family permease [Phycisphaerales bacterium]|nr:MAG: LptF/LptG family permease [Phycisphaerales bacterium]
MKILDKYVAKNFLIGYCIAFCVLIGLRIVIDLFINLDAFTMHSHLGTLAVIKNILTFYGLNTTLYFRDFAGMIAVVAAAFSLGKMVRLNELVAVMASGVSLKRVVGPILLLAILLTSLLVVDQEIVIPSLSDKLVRAQWTVPGEESYDVWFITDGNGSLICSRRFDVKTSTLHQPTIITRQETERLGIWEVTGQISADTAVYNRQTGKWDLVNGIFIARDSQARPQPIDSYETRDLSPRDIPVRRRAGYKTLLSSRQLSALAAQRTKIKDLAQLYSQKHFRITDPIINIVMLMVGLPVLVCRDPRSMKSAIMTSFGLTAACFITVFVCKILATEVIFDRVMPELWAWLPVFIFLPIALVSLDSMKT